MTFIQVVTNALALSALLPIGLFIFFYATKKEKGRFLRVPSNLWRSTEIGRTLMYQKIAWFFFLILVVMNLTLGDYWGKDAIRLVVYLALVTLFWRVLFTLRRVQKRKVLPHNALRETEIEQTKPRMRLRK